MLNYSFELIDGAVKSLLSAKIQIMYYTGAGTVPSIRNKFSINKIMLVPNNWQLGRFFLDVI